MTQYNIRSRIVSNQVISLNSFWAIRELAKEANVSWRALASRTDITAACNSKLIQQSFSLISLT